MESTGSVGEQEKERDSSARRESRGGSEECERGRRGNKNKKYIIDSHVNYENWSYEVGANSEVID
jgi:hypothetical protein